MKDEGNKTITEKVVLADDRGEIMLLVTRRMKDKETGWQQ